MYATSQPGAALLGSDLKITMPARLSALLTLFGPAIVYVLWASSVTPVGGVADYAPGPGGSAYDLRSGSNPDFTMVR
jgi:hypothetical protein